MYTIAIKDGQATRTCWDSDKREYVTTPIESLIPYLDCAITLENTAFGQFFAFVEKDVEFYDKAYRSSTYGFPLAAYVKEIHEPCEKPLVMDYVEVYWNVELDETDEKPVPEGPRDWSPRNERVLSEHPSFHGWGDWENPPDGAPTKGGMALEFTALNQYKDILLRLDTKYEVCQDLKPVWRTRKGFRVDDVLRAILNEITWSGDISKGRDDKFGDDSPENEKVPLSPEKS